MKLNSFPKFFLSSAFICISHFTFAQAQGGLGALNAHQQWKTDGNIGTMNQWLGTSNRTSLILKTNNIERMIIKEDGSIIMTDLIGDGEIITDPDNGGNNSGGGSGGGQGRGIVGSDSLGKLHKYAFSGIQNQVLTGKGAFSSIKIISGWERTSGKIVSMSGENIGVDVANPTEKLEVNGNGKFSGSISAESIKLDNSIYFGNNIALSYIPQIGGFPETFSFLGTPARLPNCFSPVVQQDVQFQFPGIIQCYQQDQSVSNGVLNIGFDGSNGMIDLAGTHTQGDGPYLLLNYYCGKNVVIGNSTSGNLIANNDLYVNKKLGVGTQSPAEALDVTGTGQFGYGSGKIRLGYNSANSFIESDEALLINYHSQKQTIIGAGDLTASGNFYAVQNVYMALNNGAVGIGTNNTNGYKLSVEGNLQINGTIKNSALQGTGNRPIFADDNGNLVAANDAFVANQWENNATGINFSNGLVGIGTTTPEFDLDIAGEGNKTLQINSSTGSITSKVNLSAITSNNIQEAEMKYNNKFVFKNENAVSPNNTPIVIQPNGRVDVIQHNNTEYAMKIQNNGGSSSGLLVQCGAGSGGKAALEVKDNYGTQLFMVHSGNGISYAKEIKVKTNGFPDYVFDKDYNLMSLVETEKYIAENGHLPNIPSAKEVEANEGILLGEMNVKLLEKIEEITLHLIEQQKQIEELKKEIKK